MEETFPVDHHDEEVEEREPEEQFVLFFLGDTECAARIDSVQGIERMLDITRVPRTPPWLEGVANLRGNILTVVDLRAFMEVPHTAPGRASRVMIGRAGEVTMGLMVDRVSEIRRLRPSEIRSPEANLGGGLTSYMRGVYLLGDRLLSVIDLGKVLLCEKMRDLGGEHV